MLLTIIFILLLVIAITILVICKIKDIDIDDYWVLTVSEIILFIVGIIGTIVSTSIAISTQTNYAQQKKRNNLNQTIASLNATKTMIIQNVSENSIVEITNYNTKVAEFKEEIANSKIARKNIFINWFIERAYDEYTGNEVEFIQV